MRIQHLLYSARHHIQHHGVDQQAADKFEVDNPRVCHSSTFAHLHLRIAEVQGTFADSDQHGSAATVTSLTGIRPDYNAKGGVNFPTDMGLVPTTMKYGHNS